jgi:hypothetical protein
MSCSAEACAPASVPQSRLTRPTLRSPLMCMDREALQMHSAGQAGHCVAAGRDLAVNLGDIDAASPPIPWAAMWKSGARPVPISRSPSGPRGEAGHLLRGRLVGIVHNSRPVVEGARGDLLIIPDRRHGLETLEDSAMLRTVVRLS